MTYDHEYNSFDIVEESNTHWMYSSEELASFAINEEGGCIQPQIEEQYWNEQPY